MRGRPRRRGPASSSRSSWRRRSRRARRRRGPRAAPVLNLAVQQCPDIDEVRLRELLSIELATARPRGAGELAPPRPRGAGELATARPRGVGDVDVRLTCSGARVSLDLGDRALGRSWRAEVDLADAPAATRLRVLVLAVTEQWSVERAEVEPARPPEPARPQEPAAAAASVAVVERGPGAPSASAWRLVAKGTLRRAGRPGLQRSCSGAVSASSGRSDVARASRSTSSPRRRRRSLRGRLRGHRDDARPRRHGGAVRSRGRGPLVLQRGARGQRRARDPPRRRRAPRTLGARRSQTVWAGPGVVARAGPDARPRRLPSSPRRAAGSRAGGSRASSTVARGLCSSSRDRGSRSASGAGWSF